MYVDEEFLIREMDTHVSDEGDIYNPSDYGFSFIRYNNVLIGNGLVCGSNDEGETDDVSITLEKLSSKIIWIKKINDQFYKV